VSKEESSGRWGEELLDRKRWGDVAGDVLALVERARAGERLPRSLLLVGPPGMGRELAAVETAAMAICPDRGPVWCECSSCARVRSGVHPDVVVVLPQGPRNQIKIDQVQEVVKAAPGRPYEGRNRVWIFDGVEAGNLGREAANAFLKTLEEPPGHVHFILLAGNPEAVLPTIRSRCQRLRLPGGVALVRALGVSGPPELVPLAMRGVATEAVVRKVREGIAAAGQDRLIELIRAVKSAAGDPAAFQLAAQAAREAAADKGEGGDELARLAAELMLAEQQNRALYMSPERQLLARFLRLRQPS